MLSLASIAAASALLSLCSGLTYKTDVFEATFDDRQSTPAAFSINTVGTYAGLNWDGLSIDEPHVRSGDEFTGVEVKSKPNYAGGPVDANMPLPSISTNYTGSKVVFFDLEKFHWGCSTTDPSTKTQVPGWCTLEVYGYAHGAKKPTAKALSFFFPKEDVKSMEMVEATMPASFKAVSRVEFNVLATKPILYLDNVKYTLYNVTDFGFGIGQITHSQALSEGTVFSAGFVGQTALKVE